MAETKIDDNKKRRERSANFSQKELKSLISIIEKYKHVIESKKTDSMTWKSKNEAWDNITNDLNSSNGDIYRLKKTIKGKYEDLKKNLKKKLAHNRMEQFKTCEGPLNLQLLTPIEEQVLSMLSLTLEGLPSIWDSDRVPGVPEGFEEKPNNSNENDNCNYSYNENLDFHLNTNDEMEISTSPLPKPDDNEVEEEEESHYLDEQDSNIIDGQKKRKSTNLEEVDMLRMNIPSELKAIKRSKKTNQCDQDASSKAELHEMRMKILRKELELKENQCTAELKMQAVRLDILKIEYEIKMKQLQKLIEEAKLEKLL